MPGQPGGGNALTAPKPGRIMGLESGRAGPAGRDERHAIPQEKLRKLIYVRALAGRKIFLPALLEADKCKEGCLLDILLPDLLCYMP